MVRTDDRGAHDGAFEAAYRRGVVEEDTPPVRAHALAPGHTLRAPVSGLALKGCVLGPDGALEDSYVVVGASGAIESVGASSPEGVDVLDTGGVILPGLIDLHNHPEFGVFAAWEPPQTFSNRYQWRSSEIYRQLIRDPEERLLAALPAGSQARYAEVRALVGGVTAIQGASDYYPDKAEALVRNVDLWIFGRHRARAMIDLPADGSPEMSLLQKILADISAGRVTAFYVHLAEGRRDDETSRSEFDRLVALGALTPATVIIHGSALAPPQFAAVAEAGAKLVWSPQSNLRLYGQTTDVAAALAAGVEVGLGADWLPTGSQSLLAELKVARRVLAEQGRPLTDRQLVEMVTAGNARIAALGDHLGVLAPGRPADLVVLERHHADPWHNVVEAGPDWVEMVMIGGDVCYGRADSVGQVLGGRTEPLEPVLAWGKDMLLDTGYTRVGGATPGPTLAQLRAALIAQYPALGPIFA